VEEQAHVSGRPSYHVRASLDPTRNEIEGTVDVTVPNRGNCHVPSLFLRLGLNARGLAGATGLPPDTYSPPFMELVSIEAMPGPHPESSGDPGRATASTSFPLLLEWRYVEPDVNFRLGERAFIEARLAPPLAPGESVTARLRFRGRYFADGQMAMLDDGFYAPAYRLPTGWYPAVVPLDEDGRPRWLDLDLADYSVALNRPAGLSMAATAFPHERSGGPASATAEMRASGVRGFGIVAAPGMRTLRDTARGVAIASYFSPGHERLAHLLLKRAKDVVTFYFDELGFYPHHCLSILAGPGRSESFGASNLVVVGRGYHRVHTEGDAFPGDRFLSWIIAHEVAHQYFGVLVADPNVYPKWLTLGLSLYLDHLYLRARGLPERTPALYAAYEAAYRDGHDTTILKPVREHERGGYDWSRAVARGKAFTVIRHLERLMGTEGFRTVVDLLLTGCSGQTVGAEAFQSLCEEIAGRDLSDFFDRALRSNEFLEPA